MEQEPLWPNDMENELSNDYFNRSHGSFDGMFSSPTHERRLNDSRNNSRGSQGDEPGKGVADPPVAPHSTTAEAEWMKIFGGDDDEFDMRNIQILDPILNFVDDRPPNERSPDDLFLEGDPVLEELFASTFKPKVQTGMDEEESHAAKFVLEDTSTHQPPRRHVVQVEIVCSASPSQKKGSQYDSQTPSTTVNNPTEGDNVSPEKEAQENEETGMDLYESDIWESVPFYGYHEDCSSFVTNGYNTGLKKPSQPAVELPLVFEVTRESQSELFTEYLDEKTSIPTVAVETYCSCKQSRCLKAYCLCFRSGVPCVAGKCGCVDCQNDTTLTAKNYRAQAMFNRGGILEETFEETCCDCRASGCLKKYCSCRKLGKTCSSACKCTNCKNRKPQR